MSASVSVKVGRRRGGSSDEGEAATAAAAAVLMRHQQEMRVKITALYIPLALDLLVLVDGLVLVLALHLDLEVDADADPVIRPVPSGSHQFQQRVSSVAPAFVVIAALSVTIATAAVVDPRLPECEFIIPTSAHSVTPQPAFPITTYGCELGDCWCDDTVPNLIPTYRPTYLEREVRYLG